MTQLPLANRLADYACGLKFADLTPEAIHETKRRFIDSIATAVGAMPSPGTTAIRLSLAVALTRDKISDQQITAFVTHAVADRPNRACSSACICARCSGVNSGDETAPKAEASCAYNSAAFSIASGPVRRNEVAESGPNIRALASFGYSAKSGSVPIARENITQTAFDMASGCGVACTCRMYCFASDSEIPAIFSAHV